MKWFKHNSDSHQNLKLESVINEFGMAGYGFWWVCDELVANQGEDYQLKKDKNWKRSLFHRAHVEEKEGEKMLEFFAKAQLIDEESLKKGNLSITKLSEYGDEYSSRKKDVPIKSRQTTDNVVLEEIRIEENRKDKKRGEKSSELVAIAPTPKETASKFFLIVSEKNSEFESLVSSISTSSRASPDMISRELIKFASYWTEPNSTGTKQRWQKETTFEVKRRLITWFGNVKQFSRSKENISKYIPAIV